MGAPNETLRQLRAKAGVITVTEAAKLISRPTSTVRNWCAKGTVPAFRDGGIWFVSRHALLKLSGNAKENAQ